MNKDIQDYIHKAILPQYHRTCMREWVSQYLCLSMGGGWIITTIQVQETAWEYFYHYIILLLRLLYLLQDENSCAMRNLELASRELVPQLRQFVSLFGKGTAVSESRAANGLPVCNVQCTLPLQNPMHVLPYLTTLPANFYSNSRFFLVSDNVQFGKEQGIYEYVTYI